MKRLGLWALALLCAGCATTENTSSHSPSSRRQAGQPPAAATGTAQSSAPASQTSRYGHPGEAIYDFPPGGYDAYQRQKQAAAQPPSPPPAPVLPPPPGVPSSGSRTYTVQPGDSLWSIAQKHGVKVDQIRAANSLPANIIKPGQKLAIP
jgi:LysM repeat protein